MTARASLSVYTAFFIALLASVGSLFFSEILHFTPCTLCWYQRICMYPLVVILGIGIYRHDQHVAKYVLPLSILGATIAFYHFLLQEGIITETFTTCSAGVSCTVKYFNYFGFINIPFLSLIAFLLIIINILAFNRYHTR